MTWKWLEKLMPGRYAHTPLPADTLDIDEIRREREQAEQKLEATRMQGRVVQGVSQRALRIRQDNQFSARLQAAFGSTKK